jgi:hypothetical protein
MGGAVTQNKCSVPGQLTQRLSIKVVFISLPTMLIPDLLNSGHIDLQMCRDRVSLSTKQILERYPKLAGMTGMHGKHLNASSAAKTGP